MTLFPSWLNWHADRQEPQEDSAAISLIMRALSGIRRGDLAPLATLLKSETEDLDWRIRQALVVAIEGDKTQTGVRLELNKHPDVKYRSRTAAAIFEKRRREDEIAKHVSRHGGLEKGMHESAIQAAQKQFGLGRSRVEEIWSKAKPRYEALAAIRRQVDDKRKT